MKKTWSIAAVVTLGLGLNSAAAQVPIPSPTPPSKKMENHDPPVKKASNGMCIASGTTFYVRLKTFIPFASVADCIKSGGHLPDVQK